MELASSKGLRAFSSGVSNASFEDALSRMGSTSSAQGDLQRASDQAAGTLGTVRSCLGRQMLLKNAANRK